MQEITLIGHLGKNNASVRESATGNRFFSFAVAVNGRNKGVTVTQWYDVICFDVARYEKMLPYLTGGSSVVVIGELFADVETYIDANGKERARCRRTVIADLIKFGPKSGNSGTTVGDSSVVSRPIAAAVDTSTVRRTASTIKQATPEPTDITMGELPTVTEAKPKVNKTVEQPITVSEPLTVDNGVIDDLPF